ncbi:DUF4158 domain-containing protein [Salinispora fenicalii]|uniref:DUF4158 domain-containing protein n=1 Tax=Salinispora fenicalii TaxID=1137263 RepID=UPI0009EA98F5|nr:DUF4158 domain-containing protein [Salinispora fenicalii]
MRSFLTSAEEAVYGRFTGPPEQAVLERFSFLDDADRDLVAFRRGDHNRLGFSLQLVTVRHLGRFLEDPLDVPGVVVDYVASQIKVADPSCVKAYLERRPTRFEHQTETCEVYGFRSYPSVKESLLAWVGDQAWATGDGPKALFYSAVARLRAERVLLPGMTTLRDDVAGARKAAETRLYAALAGVVTAEQASDLEQMLKRSHGQARHAGVLSAAVQVLFEAETWGEAVPLAVVWDAIESVVGSRAKLRTAMEAVQEFIPP